MNVGPFLVTESDVQTGSATVRVDVPGIYRVTVFDDSGRTVPNSRVSLQNSVDHVLELTTNAGGPATLVGEPDKLMHAVSLDATDLHVEIAPLCRQRGRNPWTPPMPSLRERAYNSQP